MYLFHPFTHRKCQKKLVGRDIFFGGNSVFLFRLTGYAFRQACPVPFLKITFIFCSMKIKDLSPDERPREKMIRSGASSLSNAELLAILLRTGSGEQNAIDLARELLGLSGGRLISLSTLSIGRMISSVNGIGKSKAITVAAAFELGRRFSLEGFGC